MRFKAYGFNGFFLRLCCLILTSLVSLTHRAVPVLLFLALCLPSASSALTPQEIFRNTKEAVFPLEILDEKGELISAHTVIGLEGETAVTLCSLLAGAADLRVRLEDKTLPAKTDRKDIGRNLCILRIAGLSSRVSCRIADEDPQPGEAVYAISNALGFGISISEGVVSGIRQDKGDTLIQFTAPIAPGSEGGGLFDAEGRLRGVVDYQQRDGQNVNFALPARWIGEISGRAATLDEAESWRNEAHILENAERWQELGELALKWTTALPASTEAWFYLAASQEKLKKWTETEAAYKNILRMEPSSIRAALGLASAFLMQKRYQDSLDIARSILAYRREDGTVWIFIAYAEWSQGHVKEARAAFERAAELEPWNLNAHTGLVRLALAVKDLSLAVASQRSIVRFIPDNAKAWLKLADLYLSSGRAERALNSAERALDIEPLNGDAFILKGIALGRLNRQREAVAAFRQGLELNPANPSAGWGWLGDAYNDVRLFPEAINAYREAMKISPESSSLRGRLGVALKDNFQFAEAMKLFEGLKEEDPKNPFPWRQIGFVFAYQGMPEKAIPAYEQSLSLESRQPKVWRALMEAYHSTGRIEDVKRSYHKLMAVDRSWGEKAYKELLLPYEGVK